jgi:DNA helicase-2/ATP-dependent DNA helicase PcrA
MSRIPPDMWKSVGGIDLEPNAEKAVRSNDNCLVIAGPGAGKTELLAQRACYLLETGLCPEPQSILAISFKRDAARNLSDRVERRCGRDLARRFHSFTYDACAKSLVDRFMYSLPEDCTPSRDYTVLTKAKTEEFRNWISHLDISAEEFERADEELIRANLCSDKLPLKLDGSSDSDDRIVAKLWDYLLGESKLTFPMISRLAELLLRINPLLLNALRACYSHVFLDEFQDTTGVQYDLLLTAFQDSPAILTAVGDSKQRIMGWAGAIPNVTDIFEKDFSAMRRSLFCNHRSCSGLVRMQQVFARHLDPNLRQSASTPPVAKGGDNGVCKVVLFDSMHEEAKAVAQEIADLILKQNLNPRDIAVLAKQRVDRYGREIIREAKALGVKVRLESEMQDLLSEPCVETLMSILRLATGEKDPNSWQDILHLLIHCQGAMLDETLISAIEQEFHEFLTELAAEFPSLERAPCVDEVSHLIEKVFDFIGLDKFKAHYPQYKQGTYFDDLLERTAKYFYCYLHELQTFEAAVIAFCGDDSVPIMTIHKSKGLEYDTIFFIGLEDGAFWKYHEQPHEDNCAFFVAFSRAKRRVYFTFSQIRNSGHRGRLQSERRDKIATLYDLLEEAGAEIVEYKQCLDSR